MIQQRTTEAARAVWLRSGDEIDGLVASRRYVDLEELLTEAVAAGEILERDDPDWRRTRNLLFETRALINLDDDDLLGTFFKAYDSAGQLRANGESLIREAAESGSFIMETVIRPTPDRGFFSLDLPLSFGQQSLNLTVGLPALATFLETIPDGRAFVSFEVSSVTVPESEDGAWLIEIDPMSFTFLIRPEYCDEIGLPLDEDATLNEIIVRQRDFVSESKAWDSREGITRNADEESK